MGTSLIPTEDEMPHACGSEPLDARRSEAESVSLRRTFDDYRVL